MAATVSGWTPSSDDETVSLHPALEPLDEYPAHWTTSVFKRTPSYRHTTRPAPPKSFTIDSPISDCYPSPTSSYSPSPPSPPQTRIPPPLTSSERRAIRNRLRDPNWIPRPRNAFIIFRCEYAREHARYAPGEPTRIITDKTLSKRAGDAWKKLSVSQKAIFKKRADVEREEHARQYPAYRFNPTRPTARSRSQSSPVPAPGVGRSAQVASLVEEKASTPRLVEAEPTSPGYLVQRQVPSLLSNRRPSSTPLPSSITPIDNPLAPGLSSSYPNTPYIQTYHPADGMFVQNVDLFSGYTFDSGNQVSSPLTPPNIGDVYLGTDQSCSAMNSHDTSSSVTIPYAPAFDNSSFGMVSLPYASDVGWPGADYSTMAAYPQPSEDALPETQQQSTSLFASAPYSASYGTALEHMSYQQQSLDLDVTSAATYWENGQGYTTQAYLSGIAPFDDAAAAVFQEPVESGINYLDNGYEGNGS